MSELSDEQWCVLDVLMRARQRGIGALSRAELLNSPNLPQAASIKLVWAALTMPKEFVTWKGQHDFSITEKGAATYNFKFGKGLQDAVPTPVADAVICLPGPEHYVQ